MRTRKFERHSDASKPSKKIAGVSAEVKPGVKAKVTGSKRKRIEEDTWVACDTCNKWRMLPADAPPVGDGKWYCAMNPDDRYNACGAPEQTADES